MCRRIWRLFYYESRDRPEKVYGYDNGCQAATRHVAAAFYVVRT